MNHYLNFYNFFGTLFADDNIEYSSQEFENSPNLEYNPRRVRRESGEMVERNVRTIPRKIQKKLSKNRGKKVGNYRIVRYGDGPPYRYQRYAIEDRLVNTRTNAIRNILQWLKVVAAQMNNK